LIVSGLAAVAWFWLLAAVILSGSGMVGFIAGIGAVSLVFASPAFILALKGRFCGLRSPLRSFLWHPQYCWPDPLPSRPKSTIAPASRSLRPGA